jgi:hypothetical protein
MKKLVMLLLTVLVALGALLLMAYLLVPRIAQEQDTRVRQQISKMVARELPLGQVAGAGTRPAVVR